MCEWSRGRENTAAIYTGRAAQITHFPTPLTALGHVFFVPWARIIESRSRCPWQSPFFCPQPEHSHTLPTLMFRFLFFSWPSRMVECVFFFCLASRRKNPFVRGPPAAHEKSALRFFRQHSHMAASRLGGSPTVSSRSLTVICDGTVNERARCQAAFTREDVSVTYDPAPHQCVERSEHWLINPSLFYSLNMLSPKCSEDNKNQRPVL